jgi:hypothetical protein
VGLRGRQTDVLTRERALAEEHLALLAQNMRLSEEIAGFAASRPDSTTSVALDARCHSRAVVIRPRRVMKAVAELRRARAGSAAGEARAPAPAAPGSPANAAAQREIARQRDDRDADRSSDEGDAPGTAEG